MKARTIANFLDKELDVKKIKDSSRNGLQVNSKKDIKIVGFAVDGCLSTAKLAKKNNVDLLVVHHGLIWKNRFSIFGLNRITKDFLKKNGIALYAVHLPLDLHKIYGNNIQLANILSLNNIQKFGKYKGRAIGYKGILKKAISIKDIAKILNKRLHTKCKVLDYGKNKIKSIGIVSGAGYDVFKEAKDVDCFITGEAPYHIHWWSRELKRNTIIAGHYETETFGVKSLMPLINKTFKVATIFLDNPLEG